jgi:hypothetical protein
VFYTQAAKNRTSPVSKELFTRAHDLPVRIV